MTISANRPELKNSMQSSAPVWLGAWRSRASWRTRLIRSETLPELTSSYFIGTSKQEQLHSYCTPRIDTKIHTGRVTVLPEREIVSRARCVSHVKNRHEYDLAGTDSGLR